MKEMKIGFIGYGNMAQAIATGLIASKAAAGEPDVCLRRKF